MEHRVIVTFDLDFARIAWKLTEAPASLIIFRLERPRILRIVERMQTILAECSLALEQGAIVMVEDTRHRLRALPDKPPGASHKGPFD